MSDTDGEFHGAPIASPDEETCPQRPEPEAELSEFHPAEGSALLSAIYEAEERRYGFRIGAFGFLVKPKAHSEAVIAPAVCPIPHSPPWLLGLINLRSTLVPVFDLHSLCGLDPVRIQAQLMVLVIDSGEKAVGVPIDALPVPLGKLNKIPELPPLPEQLIGSVSSGYSYGDEVWLELDHEQFFSNISQKNDFTPGCVPSSPDAIAL